MSKLNILFVGGDERQLYCAKRMLDKGYEISVYGFDKCDKIDNLFMNFKVLKIAVILADAVVLPTPVLYNGCIYAPYTDEKIGIEEIIKYSDNTKLVFAGGFNKDIKASFDKKKIQTFDFLKDEQLTLLNAELTAQGAVNILCNHLKSALSEKNILVLGYGRIAKCLIKILSSYRANLCVGARKKSDLTRARISGVHSKEINRIDFSDYDIIINTVPAKIIDEETISENEKVTFLDLALFLSLESDNYIIAKAVPGKFAPESAGKYLAEYMIETLEGGNNE